MALIAVRGLMGSGKTYVAEIMVKEFGFERVAFADPLKIEVFNALLDPNDPFWTFAKEHGITYPDKIAKAAKDVQTAKRT